MQYSRFIEKKRHGSLDFPIQYYHLDKSHPQYIMSAHWHKDFELIRVLKGKFKVFLNNIEYNLKEGDILLVECGCIHRGEPTDSIYECIVFDLNMLTGKQNDAAKRLISPFLASEVHIDTIVYNKNDKIASPINQLFDLMQKKRALL